MSSRNRRKSVLNRKKKELDIDITSLLDILVILLVFLLKSYNPSDLKLEVKDNLEMPESISKKLGNMSVTIQVSKDRKVFVNNKEIGRISKGSGNVAFLEKELKKFRDQDLEEYKKFKSRAISSLDKEALEKKQKSQKQVNIVMDKNLSYEVMQQVMHSSATAGYPKFKFIVMGKN
ncbi:biopolymer transporter ExbD [Halobacteriovorax sp. HLS]|uniref:biopolymer transporter ExbD n=1 Tax=Halobacteriovorax sp. HLS TaxID=2234000 RepID=UPI000FD8CC7F|nr:biopolymer transporter ExbD [Halobacteriovorax sp. HLS]